MAKVCAARLGGICIICFAPTDPQILAAHHHCCTRSNYCEDKFKEITRWELINFGDSLLDKLSKSC